jgi:hypothetical protein
MFNKLKLVIARVLNALYYRTGVEVFRELSNRLTLGITIKVDDIWYVLTCVSDLLELVPDMNEKYLTSCSMF